ncbi:hypothetical protein Tco_1330005 [Tanacetum coccineum]
MKEVLQEKKTNGSSLQMKSLDAHILLHTWFAYEEICRDGSTRKGEMYRGERLSLSSFDLRKTSTQLVLGPIGICEYLTVE